MSGPPLTQPGGGRLFFCLRASRATVPGRARLRGKGCPHAVTAPAGGGAWRGSLAAICGEALSPWWERDGPVGRSRCLSVAVSPQSSDRGRTHGNSGQTCCGGRHRPHRTRRAGYSAVKVQGSAQPLWGSVVRSGCEWCLHWCQATDLVETILCVTAHGIRE